jgi:hypothetical protein
MPSLRVVLSIALTVGVAGACGARTPLEVSNSGTGDDDGGTPPLDSGIMAKICPSWMATSAAMQVSTTPSIMEVQAVLPTTGGVLVGYADIQFPPVDASWQVRRVGYDASLGLPNDVLSRNTSQLDWTAVSLAQKDGRILALASDEPDGMLFIGLDDTGASTGAEAVTPGDTGRDLFATSSGLSALRNPFDPTGLVPPPVSLVQLDASGHAGASTQLLPASTPLEGFSRIAFSDGSFLLVWGEDGACDECRDIHARYFSSMGASLASPVVLHSFDATSSDLYAVAASSTDVLFVWSDPMAPAGFTLMAQAFDENGNAQGSTSTFAETGDENAPTFALAPAPGGDFLVVWGTGSYGQTGSLEVESLDSAGEAEGGPTLLQSVRPDDDERILVVATTSGAMVAYEDDPAENGTQVFAIPLQCAE